MHATYVAAAPALSDRPPLWLGAAELRRLLPPEHVIAALEAALAAAGPRAASGHAALAFDLDVVDMITNALDPAHARTVRCSVSLPL